MNKREKIIRAVLDYSEAKDNIIDDNTEEINKQSYDLVDEKWTKVIQAVEEEDFELLDKVITFAHMIGHIVLEKLKDPNGEDVEVHLDYLKWLRFFLYSEGEREKGTLNLYKHRQGSSIIEMERTVKEMFKFLLGEDDGPSCDV